MTVLHVRSTPWAFIANMYPSPGDVSYGAFVQRSYEDLQMLGFRIDRVIAIRGRLTGTRRMKAYAKHYVRLALLLFQPRVRHLYVHYASHHCVLPALGASLFGKKVVVNIHGDDLALGRSSLYRRVMSTGQSWLLRSARLVVVPSPFFKELLLNRVPDINPSRVIVSPSSGIDFQALSAATASRPSYWERSPDERSAEIGYIGRIDEDKGWESLFDAFVSLPDDLRRRATLHFWGDGRDSDRLRQRIDQEGEGRVLQHGAIPASELPSAHARFDFHVVPSRRESLGLAAIEGMGAGHVLICSAIRPFTDMTVDRVHALHTHPDVRSDLKVVLAQALQMPDDELAALAANGQSVARAFDRRVVAEELAHQIESHLVA